MAFLCLDIEATLLPGVQHTEGDKLPAAPNWQIVCIGAIWLAEDLTVMQVSSMTDMDEPEALAVLAGNMRQREPIILGFNSRAFDCPVIEARLMHYGIPCPRLLSRDVQDRYYSGHIDLMDRIANHGAATRPSLDACAKLVGFPGKGDCDGSKVADMVAAGRIVDVRAYCLRDVAQTVAVFLRREYVRGVLSLEAYQRAAQSLLACIESTPALQPLRSQIDEARFLLGERCKAAEAG